MKSVERHDSALVGRYEIDIAPFAPLRHGKHAESVRLKEQIGSQRWRIAHFGAGIVGRTTVTNPNGGRKGFAVDVRGKSHAFGVRSASENLFAASARPLRAPRYRTDYPYNQLP